MKKRPQRPERIQPMPDELLDTLLGFIQTHFYQGQAIQFVKDKRLLLQWVIFRLAKWLDKRGVTIPADRYRDIMLNRIFLEAVRHGNTSAIGYRPAWLGKVVETHLAHHGEEYYEEAKSIRSVVEHTLLTTGRLVAQPAADPVREYAAADRLLKRATKAARPAQKAPLNDQLNLL